jgi:hypothetical protein
MATITSINPFPNSVDTAFEEYMSSNTYYNREQLPYEKWHRMHVFLDDPTLKLEDRDSVNLKHRAQANFKLIHNKLY